jgi:hypothetical protein
MNLADAIRQRLDILAAASATAAQALDGAALDLPEGALAELLGELEAPAGRLDLVCDRLGAGVDPVRAPDAQRG